MRAFSCACGAALFFDSAHCVQCGRRVGFDPDRLCMVTLSEVSDGLYATDDGTQYRLCDNEVAHGVCNWLRRAELGHGLCYACQFNRTIPNLQFDRNLERWRKLEAAKRRLMYTLLALHLPPTPGNLRFDFVEDGRTNPDAFGDKVANTGYGSGTITINVVEADDAHREGERVAVNEQYRTVLGHLRHESGHHFYYDLNDEQRARFSDLFGDANQPYRKALDRYYEQGPAPDWRSRCISAYASSHPLEDWAESWGHYLHISDVLETAVSHGVAEQSLENADIAVRISEWRRLSIVLNELNRSLGQGDMYPFVLNDVVAEKLAFIDGVIRTMATLPGSATR